LAGSSVTTTLNIATELWQLNADKGQLSQVITNLVVNAKQAMPEGGALTIEAYNSKNYHNSLAPWLIGNVVCLKIIDQGVGIAEDFKAHIFDPYFTTKQGGSGLGLATVYSIIKKHKGFVEVDSTTGKGSSFNLYLPANVERKTVQKRYSNTLMSKTKADYKILVMDDEKMILDVAKEMLGILGYEVDTALNGQQAIMKYENSHKSGAPYDVVIMDLTIPGGHGGESVIKELILLNPKIKAIVTSGYSTGQIMAYPQNFGFKERLIKPFNMNDLEKTLNKILTE
jgi:CheY-like chemotaxis protein